METKIYLSHKYHFTFCVILRLLCHKIHNFLNCKFNIMKTKCWIAGLIICTLLIGSLADAQLPRSSGAVSRTEVKDSLSSAETSDKVPFCLPGEKKVCILGPPPVCHCEPQQVGSQSNGLSTSSGPISPAAGQAGPTVINFDNLVTGGWGTGGPIPVTNQYSKQGVTFNSPRAIDFSKGIAIPGFAHSGTIAIEQCYSAEFCSTPIEMKFDQPQSRVTVWVGIDSKMSGKQEVTLRAFDSAGNQIAEDKQAIDPSAGPVPIQTSLQVPKQKILTRSNIVRATVSFSDSNTFTNGLAVDDVEFESTGIIATINPVVKAGAY